MECLIASPKAYNIWCTHEKWIYQCLCRILSCLQDRHQWRYRVKPFPLSFRPCRIWLCVVHLKYGKCWVNNLNKRRGNICDCFPSLSDYGLGCAMVRFFFFRITFTFYFITTKNKKYIIPTSVNLISTGYSGRFSRQEANDRVNDGNLLVVYGIFFYTTTLNGKWNPIQQHLMLFRVVFRKHV